MRLFAVRRADGFWDDFDRLDGWTDDMVTQWPKVTVQVHSRSTVVRHCVTTWPNQVSKTKDLVNLVKFLLCFLESRLVGRLDSGLFGCLCSDMVASCIANTSVEEIRHVIIHRLTWRGRNSHLQRNFHFHA